MNRVDSSAYICMHVAIQLQAPIGLWLFELLQASCRYLAQIPGLTRNIVQTSVV